MHQTQPCGWLLLLKNISSQRQVWYRLLRIFNIDTFTCTTFSVNMDLTLNVLGDEIQVLVSKCLWWWNFGYIYITFTFTWQNLIASSMCVYCYINHKQQKGFFWNFELDHQEIFPKSNNINPNYWGKILKSYMWSQHSFMGVLGFLIQSLHKNI